MSDDFKEVRNSIEMVDISQKNVVLRRAEAVGEIELQSETVEAIKRGQIKKGNVLAVAEVAGILAAKRTA